MGIETTPEFQALNAALQADPNDETAAGALADYLQENAADMQMAAVRDNAVRARLLAIFPNAGNLTVTGNSAAFTIRYGAMYGRPGWSTAMLFALSDLFGTDDVNVDEYSEAGCETCDHGSDYGHEIVVTGATRNAGHVPIGKLK